MVCLCSLPAHSYAHFGGSLLRDIRCGKLERRVATSNPELHGCQQYWPGGCVGVQSPVADCDNVNMGAILW